VVRINDVPDKRDVYVWADFVELLCITRQDGLVSQSDLLGRLRESRDILQTTDPGVTGADSEGSISGPWATRLLAKDELLVGDIFKHLSYREATLSSRYPFELRSSRTSIQMRRTVRRHDIYLFLLLAANLPFVARRWYSPITRGFERIVAAGLQRWLPSADVHIFGTSGHGTSRYSGQLFGKLNLLSQDLNERLLVTKEDIYRGDVGDAGLDVVAWIGLGDLNSSRLVILAQAACGADWVKKQPESGWEAWRSIIHFTAPHANVIAIPHFFRSSDGQWATPRSIRSTVLIDRQRLMWLFRDFSPPVPRNTIDALLKSRKSLT